MDLPRCVSDAACNCTWPELQSECSQKEKERKRDCTCCRDLVRSFVDRETLGQKAKKRKGEKKREKRRDEWRIETEDLYQTTKLSAGQRIFPPPFKCVCRMLE